MERNRKDCTEEDLFNLSSDTVYLLFVSFCRFHKTFGFNQIVSMRDLLFFLVFNFFWIKENINSPRLGILSNFTFSVKCLDCAINLLIHTFSGGASVSWRLLPLVCVKWRVFLKQQLIHSKFNLPAIFLVTLKEQLVLRNKLNYTQKISEKQFNLSNLHFKRFSKSNGKVLTLCLGLWCLCYQQEEHQLTA